MNTHFSRSAILSVLSVVCIWPLGMMFEHAFGKAPRPCQWGNIGAADDAFVFFILAGGMMSLAAVVLGLIAASAIKRSHGRLGGLWLARVGMVLGAFSLLAFMGIPEMMAKGERAWVVRTLRTLHEAETTYRARYPHLGYSPDLASLGPPTGDAVSNADATVERS